MPDVLTDLARPDVLTDLARPLPLIVSSEVPRLSDDECLLRLARAIAEPNPDHLDEVARLIGRLAVAVE